MVELVEGLAMELQNTYMVCSAYLCALWYGDYSGLSDDEEQQVNDFVESLPASHTLDAAGEGTEFARDEITGLMADCVELNVYTFEEAA
jgi:hypothetical protein